MNRSLRIIAFTKQEKMKKIFKVLLKQIFLLLVSLQLIHKTADAQCFSNFHFYYNSSTDEVNFSQACSFDTSIHPLIFLWDFGDGNTAAGENVAHHYTSGNSYMVCLVLYVGNGPGCCQDTFCEIIDFNPASLQSPQNWISDFSISASEKNVTVNLNLVHDQSIRMSLVTISGVIIPVTLAKTNLEGKHEIDIQMNDYPAGIYLLRIEDSSGHSIARRFVFQ